MLDPVRTLLADGRFLDVALVAVAIEIAVLVALTRRGRGVLRGLGSADVLGQLAAGALLLVAVRIAVAGGDVLWVAGLVTLSLPVHVYDLWRRAQRAA